MSATGLARLDRVAALGQPAARGRRAARRRTTSRRPTLARQTGLAPATVSNIVRELAGAGPGGHRARQRPPRHDGRAGPRRRRRRRHRLRPQPRRGRHRRPHGRLLAEDDGAGLGPCHADAASSRGSPCSTDSWPMPGSTGPAARPGPGPARPDDRRRRPDARRSCPAGSGVNARDAAARALRRRRSTTENDANLGALAEHRQGVARGHDTSVFVKVSSGVGAGIVLDNQLFHGAGGTAGEIGHLTLDEQGPLCRCGSRGCLEAYTSTGAVQPMMADPAARRRPSTTSSPRPATATSPRCARSRTPGSTSAGRSPASSTCSTPRVVVVGGDMARAGELLLESARIGLRRHALDAVACHPGRGLRARRAGLARRRRTARCRAHGADASTG